MCRLVMPLFYEDKPHQDIEDKTKTEEKSGKVKYPNVILVLALFFFSLSCGIESIFQSQSFTFALCGPHNLSPKQACVLFAIANITIVGLFFASHITQPTPPGRLVDDDPLREFPLWPLLRHFPLHPVHPESDGGGDQSWVWNDDFFPILSPCSPQLLAQLSPTSQHSWLGVGEPLHRHGDHGLLHLHAGCLWLCMAGRPGGRQWVTLLKSAKGKLHLLKGGHDWVPKQCRLPGRKFWLADIPTNRFGIWLIVLFPPKV